MTVGDEIFRDMAPAEPPHVVVRFRPDVQLPYVDRVEKVLIERKLAPWDELVARFPRISLRRMFTAAKPDEIAGLQKRAAELDPTYKPANLQGYFVVAAPPDADLEALAATMNKWNIVDTAYVSRPGPSPTVNDADDPQAAAWHHLDAAPTGINARFAWGVTGGDGAGIRFIDMERGWTFNHEDLNALGITLLHGSILDADRFHGTSVLGEVTAVDNTIGGVGITPHLSSVRGVSYNGSTQADAILAAIVNLSFGDVLLLEAQNWADSSFHLLAPIEVEDAAFDAIRLATALGIVVVEAGGNGTDNGSPPPLAMDTYTNAAGHRILFRSATNPDFRDSGAIIVSAATSSAPHTRLDYAPHGARIDCYAWGQNIHSLNSDSSGATTLYTSSFGGTSGASPIVTGAALALQGIAQASLGRRFSPAQVRRILSDWDHNTRPATTETTHIGVMPDLQRIVNEILQLTPDVYLRDFVGDTGAPHTGPVSSSPDIILRQAAVADPAAAFGEGSGTENNTALGDTAQSTHDNFIYVRVLNRGSAPSDVTATIWWAPPATLLTPDMWNLIGSVNIPGVPAGNHLRVSPALVWPAGGVPAPGHYCFVGILGADRDPAPNPADFAGWDNYVRFVRDNNNVTWRNFNVVPPSPSPSPEPECLEFVVPGAPKEMLWMQLEILADLPRRAKVMLETPLKEGKLLLEMAPDARVDRKREIIQLPIKPSGQRLLRPAGFPAGSHTPLTLAVMVPADQHKGEIAVRQLWKETEVGRITWRFVPDR